MKYLLVLFLVFLLIFSGCKETFDPSKIRPGMKTSEINDLFGQPLKITDMPFNYKWYHYNETSWKDIVVVRQDTVVNYIEDFSEGLKSLSAKTE